VPLLETVKLGRADGRKVPNDLVPPAYKLDSIKSKVLSSLARGEMKNHRMWLFWVVTGAAALLSAAQDSLKPLAEIYKGGTVRFVPELVLDESSLPEEAFFESVVDIKLDPDGSVYFCDIRPIKSRNLMQREGI
jgi:hypothetical protein